MIFLNHLTSATSAHLPARKVNGHVQVRAYAPINPVRRCIFYATFAERPCSMRNVSRNENRSVTPAKYGGHRGQAHRDRVTEFEVRARNVTNGIDADKRE